VQVNGEAQTVGPENPVPPHWAQCDAVGPAAVVVEDAVVVEAVDEVLIVVMVDVLDDEVVGPPVPVPTLVVIGPLSI